MEKALSTFQQRLSYAGLRIPEEDIAARRGGKLLRGSTVVWYLFGKDERGEYLDYYAADRFSSDAHRRLYADGSEESLPAIREFRPWSDDPEVDQRLKAEYVAENRKVVELLAAKGFGCTGEEPGFVWVNRRLRTK
jgi:hypothetical protein